MEEFLFPGQQEDEKILYLVRPHALWLWASIGRTVVVCGGLFIFWFLLTDFVVSISDSTKVNGFRFTFLFAVLWLLWDIRSYTVARAYITDRRLVRFDAVFPVLEKRRTLSWGEVTKSKGAALTVFHRLLNVGVVQVIPFIAQQEDITLPYTYYFEDLAAYIDKIVHTFKTKPEEIQNIRAFVPLPKGKRY